VGRKEARIFTSIWQDADFVALPVDAQRMYFLLLSQPELSLCGRLVLAENQWAATAKGMTRAKVRADMTALAEADPRPFIIVDYATDEVLIRSFVRRDGVLRGPKLIKPLVAAATIIRSGKLRTALRDELQATLDEGTIHPGSLESVDLMIKMLSPQVNTLSHTLLDTPSDRAPDRAKEKEKELTEGSRKPGDGRATRIPPDFTVTKEMVAWARQRVPQVDGKLQTEMFINYWTAASGPNSVKKNWELTWQNWMLRAGSETGSKRAGDKGTLDGLWEGR
jgi:hypothetical protein